jgi:hypothetical protein
MAEKKAVVLNNGTQAQIPNADTLLVGEAVLPNLNNLSVAARTVAAGGGGGGTLTLAGGTGGNSTGGAAGGGGNVQIYPGDGGAGLGANPGAAGASVTIDGGYGGTGTATQSQGAGGNLTLRGGDAGADGGAGVTTVPGGNVIIDGGLGSSPVVDGVIGIGANTLTTNIGNAVGVVQMFGALSPPASATDAGFMSAADKARFDTIASNILTWQPGGTASPGVVLNWSDVETFSTAQNGAWTLYVDTQFGVAEVPAATNHDFRGLVTILSAGVANNAIVTVKDTAQLHDIGSIGISVNIACEAITIAGVYMDTLGGVTKLTQGGSIGNILGVTLVPAIEVTPAQVVLAFLEGARLNQDEPAVPLINVTTVGAFLVIAQIVNSSGLPSPVPDNNIVMDPTSTLLSIYDTTARLGDQSANFTGTTIANAIGQALFLNWTSSTTAARPTFELIVGAMDFDTDLGIPIWWNGTNWVNSVGVIV